MKKHLLRSMLVGVMTLAATGAWAQSSTLLEAGTENAAWSETTQALFTGATQTLADDGSYSQVSGGNGSYAATATIAPTANAIVEVTAKWQGRSNNGRRFDQGNASYFRFGNIWVMQNDQSQAHGYSLKGDVATATTFKTGAYRTETPAVLDIYIKVNTASNTLESMVIKNGETECVNISDQPLENADYTAVAFGYKKSGSVSTANWERLYSVTVTETQQTVSTADYTVKYVCNGTDVKEAVTRTGVVGQSITLTDADKADFYNADNTVKYIYVSDDAEGKTVADGAVVTVTFREAEKYAWMAKSNVGTFTASGEVFEGDKANVAYPLYQLNEGKLWKKDAISSTFNQQFDVTENNQAFVIDYAETDIEAIFLTEAEDVEGMTAYRGGNAEARSSQRTVGYAATGDVEFTKLAAGKYKVVGAVYSPTSAGAHLFIKAGNRNAVEITAGNANSTTFNGEISVADNTAIKFAKGGSYNAAFDYVYIQSVGELTEDELAEIAAADAWADAIAAAKALADDDAVAVGLLLDAIEVAEAVAEPTDEDYAALNKAVDLFKQNNADQEKDQTAKVATNGWKKFDGTGAGLCATQYAPAITTYDGRTAQLAEVYEGNGNRTGTIIYQDITGLENGSYKVGFYGNAFSTSARDGFECTMEDGAEDVAYVFANEEKAYIVAHIAVSTTENDFRQFDVEVTDGTIKLGMGKDTEKSTNWHTMQIYQLTWFTTAKQVYAADKADMTAAIAEAKALVNTKELNNDELNEAITEAETALTDNRLNLKEFEAKIAALKEAINAYQMANLPVAPGVYYLYNAHTQKFLSRGADWGTHAVADDYGFPLNVTVSPEGAYTLANLDGIGVYGDSYWMYADCSGDRARTFAVEAAEGGFYLRNSGLEAPNNRMYVYTKEDANQYKIAGNATPDDNISDDAQTVWQFKTLAERNEIIAARNEAQEAAAIEAAGLTGKEIVANGEPTVLTFKTGSAWTFTGVRGSNVATNEYGTELYQVTGSFVQNVEGVESGLYKVSVQGFYRDGSNAKMVELFNDGYELSVAYMSANGNKAQLKGWAEDRSADDAPNGMSAFAQLAADGKYMSETLAYVAEDGALNLTVAVPSYIGSGWFIADNVTYTKMAEGVADGINTVSTDRAAGAIYNLAGQQTVKAQKGLYIRDGKKFVVK